jgi:hypothetical protein
MLTMYRFNTSDNLTKGRSFGTYAERNEKELEKLSLVIMSHSLFTRPFIAVCSVCCPGQQGIMHFLYLPENSWLYYIPLSLCYGPAFIYST